LLLFILGWGSLGIFLSATRHTPTSSVSPTAQAHSPQALASPSTPTPTQQISIYPPLALSYAGTVSDLGVANTTTKLYLSQIQRNPANGDITGQFQGLGLSGTFTGTVTPAGQFHFLVKIDVGNLVCDGKIKVGGDLEGSFLTLDQHGNKLGEYGIWYGRPAS
jgi:hypothetical protein